MEEKTIYTFRPLCSEDLFLMFKIIGKIGINQFTACLDKDNIKDMVSVFSGDGKKANNAATIKIGISVTLEMANVIMCNLPKCENEIYQMLSNTSNLSVEEIRKLGLATFAGMVIDFIKKEEFKDFFKVALKLYKPEN